MYRDVAAAAVRFIQRCSEVPGPPAAPEWCWLVDPIGYNPEAPKLQQDGTEPTEIAHPAPAGQGLFKSIPWKD